MYQLFRLQGLRQVLVGEGPPALGALVIAEIFYKWHSFLLECLGFLATWILLSWLLDLAAGGLRKLDGAADSGPATPSD